MSAGWPASAARQDCDGGYVSARSQALHRTREGAPMPDSRKHYALIDDDRTVDDPYAVCAIHSTEDGSNFEKWDADRGEWIDTPSLASYFMAGEAGMAPITAEQAAKLGAAI